MSKKLTFNEFKQRYDWKRKMLPEEIKNLASEIFRDVKNNKTYEDDYEYIKLVNIIKNDFKKISNLKYFWSKIKDYNIIKNSQYYKPIEPDNADKILFKNNFDVPYKKKDVENPNNVYVDSSGKKIDNTKYFNEISNLNDKEPIITESGEESGEEHPKKENKTSESKSRESGETKPAKPTRVEKEMIKAKTIAEMFKGPSKAEEFGKLITEIAKDKSLMSLPKEQFQDYLKSKLKAPEEKIDYITEAVIAKRAELLGKNQLKREQLTELDVENLQEQSQRDFERKMRDQNLRYILPAMLEKRDRLVVNRLNPELLKCGY